MIKLKNIRVCPIYNQNFKIVNEDELIKLLPSVPIVINFDYNDKGICYGNMKIIGMVAPHGNMSIEDDFITSDIFIEEEYKDYVFNNYECSVDKYDETTKQGEVNKINIIGFSEIKDK